MNSIQIAGVNKSVSQLIMGTDFFNLSNPDTVHEIMELFMQMGGNTLDTAHIYSGGESEAAIGLWLEATQKRKDIVILTKGAHHDRSGPRVNRQAIYEDLMESLERLRLDSVELYGLHRDDPLTPVGEIMDALNEHIEAGRIQAIGGSNWSHQRLQEANDYARQHGLIGFSFNSPNLSLAKANEPFWTNCLSADAHTLEWHTHTQMPLLSWSSQARGFFSDHVSPSDRTNEDLVRVFYHEANWQRRHRAEQLAEQKGVSRIQIALAYVLNQPFPTCALIGPRNQAEMSSCQQGAQIKLTQAEISWLVGT
jgi:aryl-alcohol dehydrogenase-like predicted oxidoreductase